MKKLILSLLILVIQLSCTNQGQDRADTKEDSSALIILPKDRSSDSVATDTSRQQRPRAAADSTK